MKVFKLPDPGEGLVEAEIVTWRVAVGDEVKVNDIVVEVETSKSLVELPIPYAGTVAALLANEGDVVEVGSPIINIDDGVSAPAGPEAAPDQGAAISPPAAAVAAGGPEPADVDDIEAGLIGGAAPGGRVAVLVGYGPRTTEAKRRPRKVPASQRVDDEAHEQVANTFSTGTPVSFRGDERRPLSPRVADRVGPPLPSPGAGPAEPVPTRGAVLAKPPVRKLAKDLGVDLHSLSGTGAGGVITRDDVEQAAAGPAVDQPVAPTPTTAARGLGGPDIRIPIKGVRKMTAEAMVASAFTAPHVTEWLTCDVSAAVELVERLKNRREFAGVRVSPLLVVAKAVCLSLGRTPGLNAHWDEDAQEIVLKGTVNLGIAAATPRGLMVPNIKNAQQLSLLELAGAINDLVLVAKEGRTQPADTGQGTFTITNVGVFGVDAGTPILNPGEAGILCIGAIARRPWVVGSGVTERIEPRWVTTLAVSFDHRVVDGEQGSQFLANVAQILSDPGLALLF
jgi:2-oxoisovalerate dehydrogenase E2 component (dihydrolipoyl transacylase)